MVGRLLLGAYRLKVAAHHVWPLAVQLGRWLLLSREHTNFTYDLTELNKDYLASFVAAVTSSDPVTARRYMTELEDDETLRTHIKAATRASDERAFADGQIWYGRRLGWYAIVRIVKPSVVVETGVDKGLGACVLAAALLRNCAEGGGGAYYGTDINPKAGYLFGGPYAGVGEILYGDSVISLEQLDEPIDLLINDSDHSASYEEREYETVNPKLTRDAIVIGDNAHVTRALFDFARRTDRAFLFFQEQPHRHWYPGAGIGAAFARR